jgi:O-antigen ligase
MAFWWLVGWFSMIYAADPSYSLGELKNEYGYTMLALLAFFVIGQRRGMARFALRALAAGVILLCGWACATWLERFDWKSSAGHGDVGIVATYVVTVAPAIFLVVFGDESRTWRRIGILAGGLALCVVVMTRQRAAWLALAIEAALLLYLLVLTGRLPVSKRKIALAIGALGTMAIVAVVVSTSYRIAPAGALSFDTRVDFWPSVIAQIGANPLAGSGFGRQAMKMANSALIPGYNRQLWHAHNVVFNYGLGMGVPGILAVLTLFAVWARFFWSRATDIAGIAGCMLVAGVFLRNQFNDFFVRDMSLLFWALCGLFAGMLLARAEDGR